MRETNVTCGLPASVPHYDAMRMNNGVLLVLQGECGNVPYEGHDFGPRFGVMLDRGADDERQQRTANLGYQIWVNGHGDAL